MVAAVKAASRPLAKRAGRRSGGPNQTCCVLRPLVGTLPRAPAPRAAAPSAPRRSFGAALAAFAWRPAAALGALVSRLIGAVLSFVFGWVKIDWVIRRGLRWVVFDASAKQLRELVGTCEGAAPLARAALQGAELRELYRRACREGAVTPALRQEVEDTERFLEAATEAALAACLRAMDADGDGRVSLAEVSAFLDAGRTAGEGADSAGEKALVAAMQRARTIAAELERLKVGVTTAVDGAIAAVDADGDGKISVEEALLAPRRVAGWLVTWRELFVRGKL